MKLAVIAYNFPHKKTQDILLRLFLENVKISLVIACNWVELSIPSSSIHSKIQHIALLHPKMIAERIGVPYYVLSHNCQEAVDLIKQNNIDVGIIAGARILKKPIIDAFNIGIINLHPGLLPDARGLDAMLWSIYKDIPLGVTAHLIDEKIDSGRLLIKETIQLHKSDTLLDLSERLHEKQLEILIPAVQAATRTPGIKLDSNTQYNKKMDFEKELIVQERLRDYLEKRCV